MFSKATRPTLFKKVNLDEVNYRKKSQSSKCKIKRYKGTYPNYFSHGQKESSFLKESTSSFSGFLERDEKALEQYSSLLSKRLIEPALELERLQKNPIIGDRIREIRAHYDKERILFGFRFSPLHQIAYGRSLELFETFKDTHYVFNHGQSGTGFLPLYILSTLLFYENEIKNLLEFQIILRHPVEFKDEKNLNVASYKDLFRNRKRFDEVNDHVLTKSLLSVDGYLASTRQSESALSIFMCNSYRQIDIKNKTLNKIINCFISDQSIQKEFKRMFETLEDKVLLLGEGNLYTICIPKEYFNECGYLSHPFGEPLELEEPIDSTLKKMQEESSTGKPLPQVRLLTHKLDPNKIKIFISPTMTDDIYKKIVKDIATLVEKYQSKESLTMSNRCFTVNPHQP